MQLHAPVERLAVHHVDQNQADGSSRRKAGERAEQSEQPAFRGEHGADLRTGEAEVAQHAELAPPREHDGAEAGREPEQADQHRHGLHRIGDGEAAVEDAQRQLPDLPRRGEVDPGGSGQRADRVHRLGRRRARREP